MSHASHLTANARQLRREQTDAERLLWSKLARRQLGDAKFRRQQPIGPYIVDFVSFEGRLVVELDGGQHNDGATRADDATRTSWLEGRGYRVLRFWNTEALGNLEGVLTEIKLALVEEQSPSPREGEGMGPILPPLAGGR